MKWISVDKRMPDNRKAVIVWCPQRQNKYMAWWSGNFWFHFGGLGMLMTGDVTHWMPTPAPPKEGK
jgi:hypothetical protein